MSEVKISYRAGINSILSILCIHVNSRILTNWVRVRDMNFLNRRVSVRIVKSDCDARTSLPPVL